MAGITFDTLGFVRRLRDSGIPEAQADLAPTSQNTAHWSVRNGAPTLEDKNEQAVRERRVTALRSWLDTLPEVPPVPAHAIDRSELY